MSPTSQQPASRAAERVSFLRRLRAVRRFRQDPVPPAALDDILEVARWSGSASNRQPWEFVVVRDREMLRRLGEVPGSTGHHVAGAPLAIVLVMSGDPQRVALETYDEGRLAERIMLAAAAHGLGACIGFFTGGAASEAKRLLSIPEDRLVRTAVSIGYADRQAQQARTRPAQPRKPLAELVRYERYQG